MVRQKSSASSDTLPLDHWQEDGPLYSADTWTMDESLGYLLHQVRGRLLAAIDTELGPLDITWSVGHGIVDRAKPRTSFNTC